MAGPGGISYQTYSQPISANDLTSWVVSGVAGGNTEDGTMVKGGVDSHAIYTAPATIDKDRYVTASITYTNPITVHLKKAKIITLNNKTFTARIKLLSGNFYFDLAILYKLNGGSGVFDDINADGATMQIDVKNWKVTNVTWQNQDPTKSPSSGSDGSTKATFIGGSAVGMINISQADANILGSQSSMTVYVQVANLVTVTPKWDMVDLRDNSDYFVGGDPILSPLQEIYFELTNDPQNPNPLYFLKITIPASSSMRRPGRNRSNERPHHCFR